MAVSREDIDAIAQLARLHLEPDERARLQSELDAILDHFAALAQVDTTDVPPMTHAVPMDLRLRVDAPAPSFDVEIALRAAPARAGELFVVPAVLPGDE